MHNSTLLVMAATAGIFLLAAVVVLLYQRKIFIDKNTGKPTEIEMPLLGRMKTQNPVVALVLVGAGLVIYPCASSGPDMRTLEGTVKNPTGRQYTLAVVAGPHYGPLDERAEHFAWKIPVLPDATYKLLLLVDGQVIHLPVKREAQKLVADPVELQLPRESIDLSIQPSKEASHEEIRAFLK